MKKVLALILALVMVFALCACGSSAPAASTEPAAGSTESAPAASGSELAGTYDITVWVADAIVDLTKQQIADFNASNTDGITFNATVEAVGEADSATQMITAPRAPPRCRNSAPAYCCRSCTRTSPRCCRSAGSRRARRRCRG